MVMSKKLIFVNMITRLFQIQHFAADRPLIKRLIRKKILQQLKNLIYYQKTGPVAQRLEQWTHNPLVVGSNPTGPIQNGGFLRYIILDLRYNKKFNRRRNRRMISHCRVIFFKD
jgi:hypothetical protein